MKIRDILKAIKGKFIMSINDTREIRDIYKDFRIEKVKTVYMAGGSRKKGVTELLIMNY